MWHWSQTEIEFMKRVIEQGYRWASRGESTSILTFHRNPIKIFIMGEWCSEGTENDYMELRGDYLPHLLAGQFVDMVEAVKEDNCPACGKGNLIYSPVLRHHSFLQKNQSVFSRHWECPICGAHGDYLYAGRLERIKG